MRINGDIEIVAVGTGAEAMEALLEKELDCIVLDLHLPDMIGFELMERMHAQPGIKDVPVVVFTGKDLDVGEQTRLKVMARSIILKDVQSPERLLDETALFLHRVVAELPPEKRGTYWNGFTAPTRFCATAKYLWSMTTRAMQYLRIDFTAGEPGHGRPERDEWPERHRDHPEHSGVDARYGWL